MDYGKLHHIPKWVLWIWNIKPDYNSLDCVEYVIKSCLIPLCIDKNRKYIIIDKNKNSIVSIFENDTKTIKRTL